MNSLSPKEAASLLRQFREAHGATNCARRTIS